MLKKGSKWRYWINLCGQDFPLKSQNSISKYLSIVYPGNIVESIHMPEGKIGRYTQSFEILPGSDNDLGDSERAYLKIDHFGHFAPHSFYNGFFRCKVFCDNHKCPEIGMTKTFQANDCSYALLGYDLKFLSRVIAS